MARAVVARKSFAVQDRRLLHEEREEKNGKGERMEKAGKLSLADCPELYLYSY